MKFEEFHDLRIILKSGSDIITKNVRDWKFSDSSWNITWARAKDKNIAKLSPSEIAAVVILARRHRLVWK